jgi:PAS domain S-box-containing protein
MKSVILLVAAKTNDRALLRQIFEHENNQLVEAESPRQCMTAIRKHKPDLLIVKTPLGTLDPTTLFAEIRALTTVPQLLLAEYDHVEAAFKAAPESILTWPVHPLLLRQRVRSMISGTFASDTLRETATLVNSSLDLEAVFDRIMDGVQRVLPNRVVNLMLIENDMARSVRRRGYDTPEMEKVVRDIQLPVMQTTNLERMIRTGQPDIIPDTTAPDANWHFVPELAWQRSALGAPIRTDKETVGFLMIDADQTHIFTEEHTQILQAFANQVGIAIRNARLYGDARNHAETLEKRVQERTSELEHQRAQVQAILDAMSEGVQGVLFANGSVTSAYTFVNPALIQLLGYRAEEMLDTQIMKPDDVTSIAFQERMDHIRRVATQDGHWKGELRLRHKNGDVIDVGLTVSAIMDPDQSLRGLVTVFRDLSQQKTLDSQKKRFIANAAHELKSPISSIRSRLYLMRKTPERLADHLQIMDAVTDQLENLLEEMLDLSRFENGVMELNPTEIELVSFVRDNVLLQEAQAEGKDIWLIDRLPTPPLFVSMDRTRMMQVFSNLLTNAIKFTPEGGAVIIRVIRGKPGTTDEGYSIIEVDDTGPGIPQEHLDHIFEPFYQVEKHAKGMGLGLSIIKEIIEMHGGRISVRSEVGKGTCFSVWLKLVQPVAQAIPERV